MMEKNSYYCEKCNRTQAAEQFYGSNNVEKYPSGKLNQCKKCLTMHVDNFNPDTYLWILQECDVPYVTEEWNKLLMSYGQNRQKLSGMTILGRYLSKMKLKQYNQYRWKDTEFLQEMAQHKIEQSMRSQGYDIQQIEVAKMQSTETLGVKDVYGEDYVPPVPEGQQDDYFAQRSGSGEEDFDDELTEEDRKYLRLKWGKVYRPEQWIKLEQLYQEMLNSYDIQTAGHIDTLKLICKTSLKANELIDLGDVEGFQKMSKVYDTLMKSGKFTAAQNKAQTGEFVDSISELVSICEREGFIPRFYTDQPKDRVDETIKDLQQYTRQLVIEEMNLGNLIENAVKQMSLEESKEEDEDDEDEDLDMDEVEALTDQDYNDFTDFEEELQNADVATIETILAGGG